MPALCIAPLRWHRLRQREAYGCATLLTAASVAPRVIMEILGHNQISITMDVYTHVVHEAQREAISHMDRLLRRRRPDRLRSGCRQSGPDHDRYGPFCLEPRQDSNLPHPL